MHELFNFYEPLYWEEVFAPTGIIQILIDITNEFLTYGKKWMWVKL